MTNLQVTMACGPYDRLQALKEGIIKPEGIDLRYIEIQSPPEIFARMLKTHSFDIAEMSSAHYITMKSRVISRISHCQSFRRVCLGMDLSLLTEILEFRSRATLRINALQFRNTGNQLAFGFAGF